MFLHISNNVQEQLISLGHPANLDPYLDQSVQVSSSNTHFTDYVPDSADFESTELDSSPPIQPSLGWTVGDRPHFKSTQLLFDQAWQHYRQGRLIDALQSFEAQLLEHQSTLNLIGMSETLIGIGRVTTELGREAAAAIALHQAFDLAAAAQTVELQGHSLYELGFSARKAGLSSKAIYYFKRAACIFASLNDDQSAGYALTELGKMYGSVGRLDRMHQLCAIAADILRDTDDLSGEAQARFHCGCAAYRCRNYLEAIAQLERASSIQLAIEDVRAEATTREWLGHAYRDRAQYRQAMCCYWDAWTLYQELGDRQGALASLIGLGQVYEQDDMLLSALDAYHQVIDLLNEICRGASLDGSILHSAKIFERTGDIEQALDCYRQIIFDSDLGDTEFSKGGTR